MQLGWTMHKLRTKESEGEEWKSGQKGSAGQHCLKLHNKQSLQCAKAWSKFDIRGN